MVKLFVGNLPPSASNQSLKEIFQNYQDLQDYKLISNYGFVYLETQESAIHAVNNINGLEYRGFTIAVDFARENNQLKRKADITAIDNKVPKSLNTPIQQQPQHQQQQHPPQRFIPPNHQPQRNMNPYNLPFLNNANNINRPFDNNLLDKRYNNNNPIPPSYNNGFDSYREECDPRSVAAAAHMNNYPHTMVARPPINKRMKPDSFIDDDAYDFNYVNSNRYQMDYQPPEMFNSFRDDQFYGPDRGNKHQARRTLLPDDDDNLEFFRREMMRRPGNPPLSSNMNMLKSQPNWYEINRQNMNRQYLSDRDQRMYVPRRGNKRQIKNSYIKKRKPS